MSLVVGVDIGSSSARAVAIDADGTVAGSASIEYDGRTTWAPGHADPIAWREAARRAIAELVGVVPAAASPAAVGVGGQSPSVVRSDGSDAVTVMHEAAGDTDPHTAHAHLWTVIRADGVRPFQSWDWVLHAMGAPHQQGRWPDTPGLDGFGPVHLTGTIVGETVEGWGIDVGTPLVPGAADAQMAFWAAGIDAPGRGLDPGGRTGGLGVAKDRGDAPPTAYGLRAAAAGIDIVGGPVTAHGLAVDWWARMVGRPVEELIEASDCVPPGARGLLALPYFAGERAPRWNRNLRAELVGLDESSDAAQIMRALLEGCAFGLRHIAESVAAEGAVLDQLVVAGSPSRSGRWNQIKADVLGVPVEVPSYPELAAYGAAIAGGAGVGWWPRPMEGKAGDWPGPQRTVIEPRPVPQYDDAYRRWVALGDAAVARVDQPQP